MDVQNLILLSYSLPKFLLQFWTLGNFTFVSSPYLWNSHKMADFDSLCYYTPGKFKVLTNKLDQSLDSYCSKHGKLFATMLTPKLNTNGHCNNYTKPIVEWSHPFSDLPARFVLFKTFYSFYLRSSCYVFRHLHTINLSNNSLSIIPDDFGSLSTLKECYLSFNDIKYLPDNFSNLQSLLILHLNSNKLVYLPTSIRDMKQLEELDLYDNIIVEFPWFLNRLLLLDMYENFVEELFDDSYLVQAEKFRTKYGYERSIEWFV